MRLFSKIAIVGTGLIGGSIAMAVKEKGLAEEVIGVSRHKKSLRLAQKNRIIDRGSQDLGIIAQADLVILATPVNTVLKLAEKISRIVSKGCIVTDVGSTKQEIVLKLGRLFGSYVGSHPLAGSEKRSIANARAGLFEDSLCIVTPVEATSRAALKKVIEFWKSIGAKTILLPPSEHDLILAFVSHLPHAVAFSLINCIPGGYFRFAASGLKDTTRIAASDSAIWEDIFLSNQKNVLKTISAFEARLSALKSALRTKNNKRLRGILKLAKAKRDSLFDDHCD